ncbi:hypothetical protein [Streptomyces sp. NPDC004014]
MKPRHGREPQPSLGPSEGTARAPGSVAETVKALSRWGHTLLPLVLIAVGLLILVEGGAFAL